MSTTSMSSRTRTARGARSSRTAHRAAVTRRGRGPRVALTSVQVAPQQLPVEVAAAPRGRTRITRRGRLVVLLGLVALLLAAFSLGRVGPEASTSLPTPPKLVEMTVQPGESLWTVARRLAPTSDPREVIQRIRRINHMPGSSLRVGQQLLLPA